MGASDGVAMAIVREAGCGGGLERGMRGLPAALKSVVGRLWQLGLARS